MSEHRPLYCPCCDSADVCVAFIRDGSRGASHTARLAQAAGITTHRYTTDEETSR